MSARERLKVLQLGKYYHPYRGGIEHQVQLLCDGLRSAVDLDVLVCNSERGTRHDVVDGVRVTRCSQLAHVASTSLCPTMPIELRKRTYDILHFHFPHPMGVASYLASSPSHPHAVVVTYHSDIVRQSALLQAGYAPFMNRVLDRADAIICTSPDYIASSAVLRRYEAKCTVIPCGIDPAEFEPRPELLAEAARIRARFTRPVLLSVGRLIYYKGFEHLIRAMRSVDADLVIVGTGPLRERLLEVARESGVAERVHLVGEVASSLAAYYHACDAYVLPSTERSEAFAVVQLEAMICKKPVINTDLRSGVPFVSRHGESGLTVRPSDAGALADAIGQLLGDRELARRFGEAGRARVLRDFTKDSVAARTLELYRKLARVEAACAGEQTRRPATLFANG